MPRCSLQTVQGITVNDLKSAVRSYTCSTRYLKKIVPLTVQNIIYHRVNFDENLFANKSVCDISFKNFKSRTKNHILTDVFYWCKGAVDAIEKKYLRELHLFFQNNDDNSIIEKYKYTFTYEDEPSDAELPASDDVITATRQFFTAIESLSKYNKMEKNVKILIEVVLFEDGIAANYVVPYFAQSINTPFCVRTLENSETITVARIKTGYHKVKCVVQGLNMDTANDSVMINETMDEEMTSDQKMYAQSDISNTILIDNATVIEDQDEGDLNNEGEHSITSHGNENLNSDKFNFRCPCNINGLALAESVKKIKCTVCSKYQHLNCVGYINLDSLVTPYICVYCDAPDNNASDKYLLNINPEQWGAICGTRVVLNYCYLYGKVPTRLMRSLDEDIRKTVKDLIKGRTFNRVTMINIMCKLFIDFHMPSSMTLMGSSQDTVECD